MIFLFKAFDSGLDNGTINGITKLLRSCAFNKKTVYSLIRRQFTSQHRRAEAVLCC